jgi:hypothetical protein
LEQNLQDVVKFVALLNADLQAYWDTYKSVLQPRYRNRHRPLKMPLRKFYLHVYGMEPFVPMENPGLGVVDDDGDDGEWVES